jgi:hypothetical protein
MEVQEVRHITEQGRYKMVIEQSAVKGVLGYKVEVNGDNMTDVIDDIQILLKSATGLTMVYAPEVKA